MRDKHSESHAEKRECHDEILGEINPFVSRFFSKKGKIGLVPENSANTIAKFNIIFKFTLLILFYISLTNINHNDRLNQFDIYNLTFFRNKA